MFSSVPVSGLEAWEQILRRGLNSFLYVIHPAITKHQMVTLSITLGGGGIIRQLSYSCLIFKSFKIFLQQNKYITNFITK